MEKKLGLKVISSAALAGLLFTAAPALPADAATDNYASTVTRVAADDEQTIGNLVIREDEDSDGFFYPGDVITVNLPAGVEFSTSVTEENYRDYVSLSHDQDVKFVAAGDNFISVEIVGDQTDHEAKLTFNFPKVDIDSDVEGDIKVQVEAHGTAVDSSSVTVARVIGGGTVTTISDVESIGIDTTGDIGTIRITEATVGKLKAEGEPGYEDIELTLPNDYEWVKGKNYKAPQGTAGLVVEVDDDGFGTDTLKIKIKKASTGTQAGFISLSGLAISVPDDADNGDEVEVTVDGNETTKEDVVIAKVGDFGFEVETEGDIPTVIAGKNDQDVVQINIDDVVDGSWIKGRSVTLELPTWAEWNDTNDDGPLETTKVDEEEWKLTVIGETGEAELEDLTVNIDSDAPEGDLVVTITGSQGIDEEVVIAKVLPPFKVSAEKPEFQIGVNNQEMGDIVITETEDEAIEENKWIIVKAPNGMYFADTPTVKVTDGDIEIDDEDTDDEYFAFRIDAESAKSASEITISDIKMNLDRTVPVGDITFDIFMTSNDAMNGYVDGDKDDPKNKFDANTKFSKAIDSDYYEKVTDVVVGTVVTPAPDEAGNSVVMNLGSTLYTVNGATKVMDVAPQVIDGRTFTPVRYVAESIGATVAYDEATKTATLTKGETVVEFVLGSKTYTVNGAAQTMDVAAQAINGRTMLPARYVAQAFGYEVGFDPASKTVVISK
ncbi:copper amine oxidase N-terminal domain-containing protein [Peptococcaceae bacterium 1198_IL3148]